MFTAREGAEPCKHCGTTQGLFVYDGECAECARIAKQHRRTERLAIDLVMKGETVELAWHTARIFMEQSDLALERKYSERRRAERK